MWGVSALIGPALGAVLTGTVGWRWVFWINLPMIAVVSCAARLALRGPAAAGRGADRPLNLLGPVLLGSMVAVLLAMARHALPAAVLGRWRCCAQSPSSCTSAARRRRSSPTPPTRWPPTSARSRPARPSWAPRPTCRCSSRWGSGIQRGGRGLALVLCTLGWTTGSMGAARVGASLRTQITVGTSLTVAATAGDGDPGGGALAPVLGYTVSGLGMGIASPALFAAVLAEGSAGREGQVTSSIPLARQVGSGVGAAVAGSCSRRR